VCAPWAEGAKTRTHDGSVRELHTWPIFRPAHAVDAEWAFLARFKELYEQAGEL
jgi:hypothetical protein